MRKRLSLLVVILFGLLTVLVACGGSKVTVTFDTQGGSEVQAVKVDSGSKVARPSENPTKAGFDFDNWYEDKDGNKLFNFDEPITKNVTVYAVWVEEGFQLSDQEIVDKVKNELTLGDLSNLTNDSPRLILPAQKDGATITWAIDKTDYISAAGVVSQPENEVGNQVVTITATIKKGEATATKKFSATVVALPPASEAEALLDETFKDFEDGNILDQVQTVGVWAPVSGKTGNSTFNVVSGKVEGEDIPNGSKALKMNSWGELQIETALVHDLDLIVVEADLLQTSGAGAIHIQNGTGGDRVTFAFGITGSEPYYRVGVPNPQVKLGSGFADSKWHTFRAELNTKDQTFELFVYENDNLKSLSGLVSYEGNVVLDTLILRTGSSNETSLREASSYVTNIKVNRIEALPRPEETVKLGQVSGLEESKNIQIGTEFIPDVLIVKGLYGEQKTLVKDTDYKVDVVHEIDKDVAGEYTVTYTITNLYDETDKKVLTQTVTYFDPVAANEIQSATATEILYEVGTTDISISVIRAEGTLYYAVSEDELDGAQIKALNNTLVIDNASLELKDIEVPINNKVYLVTEVNELLSAVKIVEPTRQKVEEIRTPEEFYDMAIGEKTGIYYLLKNDIDFEGFNWVYLSKNFRSTLNGDGHKISNLTYSGEDRTALFSKSQGATIKNLVIENFNLTATGRAGILIGESSLENTIDSVIIISSKIIGTSGNGVGGFVGYIPSGKVTISNSAIIDSTIHNTHAYAGGAVGRSNSEVVVSNFYSKGLTTLQERVNNEGGSAAILGMLDNQNGIATFDKVVVEDYNSKGYSNAGVIGFIKLGSVTLNDIFIDVEFTLITEEKSPKAAGVIGNNKITVNHDKVYGISSTEKDDPVSLLFLVDNKVETSDLVKSWWEKFQLDETLWDIPENGAPVLKLASTFLLPKHLVTFVFEEGLEQENIIKLVTEGQALVFDAPELTGYEYAGLFTDEARTNALPEDFTVAEAITIYVKYDAQATATVTFDTLGGPAVENVTVNIGSTLEEFPDVANHEFDGVLKEVTGWTLNDEAFALTTPINESITLVAVWEVVKHTVIVDGVVQQVSHGEAAVEPDTPQPDALFPTEVYFVRWVSGGTEFDFTTPITKDTVITSEMSLPESLTITTPEQLHHALESFSGLTLELGNDIDLITFDWTPITNKFEGVIDGKNFTLSRLTTEDAGRNGLLPYGNNVTIQNLVIENSNIKSTGQRNGLLISEVEKGTVTIENVLVKNSAVEGASGNGVGALIGFVKGGATVNINNVAIIDTTVDNATEKYAGGVIGRVELGIINMNNVYLNNNETITNKTGTDAGSAALIGYVRNASAVSIKAVVVDGHNVTGDATGAVFGYIREGQEMTATFEDVFVKADLQGVKRSAGIVTRYNGEPTSRFDASDVYGILTGTIENAESQQLDAENVVTEEELVASFWTEKVTLSDTLWTIPENGIPVLKIAE